MSADTHMRILIKIAPVRDITGYHGGILAVHRRGCRLSMAIDWIEHIGPWNVCPQANN